LGHQNHEPKAETERDRSVLGRRVWAQKKQAGEKGAYRKGSTRCEICNLMCSFVVGVAGMQGHG